MNQKVHCCSEPNYGSDLRNQYFRGKRLSPESFRIEQAYGLRRRRLLNQAIHGHGIVYGFKVVKDPQNYLSVNGGVALDRVGRELIQVEPLKLPLNQLIVFDPTGMRIEASEVVQRLSDPTMAELSWLLSVHYGEQQVSPVLLQSSCSCDHHEWDYVYETVRYSIRPIKQEDCLWGCDLECDCSEPTECNAARDHDRGSCCLDDYVSNWEAVETSKLCEIRESCQSVQVDLENGVSLARINFAIVGPAECPRIELRKVEQCGWRRLVKSNDVLFDLIRGCDLTRIESFGWQEWNSASVDFEVFAEAFGESDEDACVTRDFWVSFTKPVKVRSLRPESIVMRVFFADHEEGWWEGSRVPIVAIEPVEAQNEHTRKAKVAVSSAWIKDALRGRYTRFQKHESKFEIEVRGDIIQDCNGQSIDANRNGSPGGVFLTCFSVNAPKAGK